MLLNNCMIVFIDKMGLLKLNKICHKNNSLSLSLSLSTVKIPRNCNLDALNK